AGDLNHDGHLDLVTVNPTTNDATILLGHGNGTFGAGFSVPVGSLPTSVVLADVNKDGNLDIVTANSESNTVSVLLGDGNGGFAAAMNFATGGMMAATAASWRWPTSTAMAPWTWPLPTASL